MHQSNATWKKSGIFSTPYGIRLLCHHAEANSSHPSTSPITLLFLELLQHDTDQ
jgi:hypothetical protein